MSGGSEANKSGSAWESWVSLTAQRQGFAVLPYKNRAEYVVPLSERRVVWMRAPYMTIFGKAKKQADNKTATEFLVEAKGQLVRIECKWQNTSGSVDEKIPFMYLNAVLTMEESVIVFAFGGKFYHTARGNTIIKWIEKVAKVPPDWLSDSAKQLCNSKEIVVLTNDTFERWFRERFPKS